MNKKTRIVENTGFIAKEVGNPYGIHLPAIPSSSISMAAAKNKEMDVEVYSAPSRDELSPFEEYGETGFDLEQIEKELLKPKPRSFFDWLIGYDPDKGELEHIIMAKDKIRARCDLREEIVRFELQKSRITEALFDSKLAMAQKKMAYELEVQQLKTHKAELALTEQRLRKRIKGGNTSNE